VARRTVKLWQLLLAGPFLIWAGWDEYCRLDHLEKAGGTLYVNSFTKFLYDLGGKNAVLVVTCGLGVFYLYLVKRFFDKQREAHQRIAAAERPGEPDARPASPPRREPPPRLGDDPFREPPRAAPIAVVRPPTAPAATPMAEGKTDDGPKILR
jgi:hypothetical protein